MGRSPIAAKNCEGETECQWCVSDVEGGVVLLVEPCELAEVEVVVSEVYVVVVVEVELGDGVLVLTMLRRWSLWKVVEVDVVVHGQACFRVGLDALQDSFASCA
eukprot:6475314-Amphidinium_carterae.3